MSHPSSYLLFIDNDPISEDLKKYFNSFNIKIVQQNNLQPIRYKSEKLTAILIHWFFLQKEPKAIQQFYTNYHVPLLIINDTPNDEACVEVLESGADDFLVKPLCPRELHARISAINRRVLRVQQIKEHEKEVIIFSEWKIYPASRQVFYSTNKELPLSAGEYELLLTFVQHPQQVLDRELLLQVTKNSDLNPLDRRIDVQISRLRQKIEVDPKKPSLIKTIRNGGYMFIAPVVVLTEGCIK